MLGFRFGRWVHAAIAGGTLAMTGCVDRLLDATLDGSSDSSDDTDSDSGSSGDGTDSSGTSTNSTEPTSPTNPSGPTDPTVNPTTPTDPTVDPTDPTDPTDDIVNGPPQLVDVRMISPTVMEMVFSEAMGPVSDIDVTAFRLSVAFANYYSGKYDYGGTNYQALSVFNGEEVCYEYCYCDYKYDEYCYKYYGDECFENCYQQPGPPIGLRTLEFTPGTFNRVQATLDSPINNVCNAVRQVQEGWDAGGLFLHYSNNVFPAVVDSQGEPLLPIAEHWVLAPGQDFAYQSGYFQQMVPFIPVDCPF